MRNFKNVLVTGGSGFIGANFIQEVFATDSFQGNVINVDKLTYAGNPENLKDIDGKWGGTRYFFEREDICQLEKIKLLLEKYQVDCIVHFAAESHVDRSILGPAEFIKSNIDGTFCLLEAARGVWKNRTDVLFHHISTDEVFGSLGDSGYFYEDTPYQPRSPYSASKAASDHLVMAYFHTYNMPVTMSNCSNNYGPYQFPEKLVPHMILNILDKKPLPIYGAGTNIRDWLYVTDHATAIWKVVTRGEIGQTYNVGGENEWQNLTLVQHLCEEMAAKLGEAPDHFKSLITYVTDRPGHDMRYAINCDKIKTTLDWRPSVTFTEGLKKTIDWYLANKTWIANIQSGQYRAWVEQNYDQRPQD